LKPLYEKDLELIEVSPSWTKYLMSTHPVVLITTIGRVRGKVIPGVAVFATCADTSYEPPQVTFATAVYQHSLDGQKTRGKTNTYLNIRQNGLFVVNLPGAWVHRDPSDHPLDTIAYPYPRREYKDKLELAKMSGYKREPFKLNRHQIYPPLIGVCMACLECEAIDVHRPPQSDHYLVTGKVVAASYKKSLGNKIDDIRCKLARYSFHHFGRSSDGEERFIAASGVIEQWPTELTFHLEGPK